ncbi:MAG TPA: hypothetical protein VHN98_07750 [Acidimicrobiales bacterium]|nr:hypothetical protein [Acidimicrobiales bacterium]
MSRLDLRSVVIGAAVALGILLAAVLIARLIAAGDRESDALLVLPPAFLIAFFVGGRVAATRAPERGYTHAMAAGTLGLVVGVVAGMIEGLVAGRQITAASLFFLAIGIPLAASIALLGAASALRSPQSTKESP